MLGRIHPSRLILAALSCLAPGCHHAGREAPPDRREPQVQVIEQRWPGGQLRLRRHVLATTDPNAPGPIDHGTYTTWHENGNKRYEAVYVHGKLHGLETQWHSNGQKWTEQYYDHGLRHGSRYDWDQTGNKRKEEHYHRDKPDGAWTIWDAAGRIKWQASFDKGKPVS